MPAKRHITPTPDAAIRPISSAAASGADSGPATRSTAWWNRIGPGGWVAECSSSRATWNPASHWRRSAMRVASVK